MKFTGEHTAKAGLTLGVDMLVSLHTVQCTTPKQNELVLGSDETSGVTQSCDRAEQPIRVRRGFACRKDTPEELIGVNFGTG